MENSKPETGAAPADHAADTSASPETKAKKFAGNGAVKDPGAELAKFSATQQAKKEEKKPKKAKAAAKPKKAKKEAPKPVKKAKAKKAAKGKEKGKAKSAAKKGSTKPGIGAYCETLLKAKKSTEEIMKAVQGKFPGAKTSPASIAWYRSKMREEGTLPKA